MKTWLIILAAGLAAMVACNSLPVYTSDQTASTHPGYRHTTMSSRGVVYVNDYEENSLQLINRDPTQAIGRYGIGGKICAIPGQKTTDYIAADVGSEMPAYAVFRNSQLPPFDWRHANFKTMDIDFASGPRAGRKSTADPALIADLVRTLDKGIAATPQPPLGGMTNVGTLILVSDQLPGMTFNPSVYMDATGPVYVAENVLSELDSSRALRFPARWIAASPEFTKWARTLSRAQ